MKWATLKFSLEPKEDIFLPLYKGATLRGGFGHALKKVTCVAKQKNCHDCSFKASCLYTSIFETPGLDNHTCSFFSGNNDFPRPFVIEPPLEETTHYTPSDSLRFNVILLGRAIEYFPYFIFSFEELGNIGVGKGRGKYRLERVVSVKGSNEIVIYSAGKGIVSSDLLISTFTEIKERASSREGVNETRISFITPTRIKHGGKLTTELPFHFLIQSLLIRTEALAFHSGYRPKLDFGGLMAKAMEGVKTKKSDLGWKTWQRYSQRKNAFMNLEGMVGQIIYQGELDEYLPYLFLGEEVHVGKSTSFGLGRMKVESL
jgi:hypothetical protein